MCSSQGLFCPQTNLEAEVAIITRKSQYINCTGLTLNHPCACYSISRGKYGTIDFLRFGKTRHLTRHLMQRTRAQTFCGRGVYVSRNADRGGTGSKLQPVLVEVSDAEVRAIGLENVRDR